MPRRQFSVTVTDLARLRGWSTLNPRLTARWYESSCIGTMLTMGCKQSTVLGTLTNLALSPAADSTSVSPSLHTTICVRADFGTGFSFARGGFAANRSKVGQHGRICVCQRWQCDASKVERWSAIVTPMIARSLLLHTMQQQGEVSCCKTRRNQVNLGASILREGYVVPRWSQCLDSALGISVRLSHQVCPSRMELLEDLDHLAVHVVLGANHHDGQRLVHQRQWAVLDLPSQKALCTRSGKAPVMPLFGHR